MIAPRLFGGRVRLGLNRTKLRCVQRAAKSLKEPMTRKRGPVKLTEESRQRRGSSSKSDAKAKVGTTGATGEAMIEAGDHMETTRRSLSVVEWTVRSGGSETGAYWEFRAIKPKDVVCLSLVDREVAPFLIRARALITCGIEFMDSDLRILGSDGLFTGHAGSDAVVKWGVVLGVVRIGLATDLRRGVELPSMVEGA